MDPWQALGQITIFPAGRPWQLINKFSFSSSRGGVPQPAEVDHPPPPNFSATEIRAVKGILKEILKEMLKESLRKPLRKSLRNP